MNVNADVKDKIWKSSKMIIDVNDYDKYFFNRTTTLTSFFEEIRKYPLLTASEERKLLELAHGKDKQKAKAARDKLIVSNQRFILTIAKKWQKNSDIMDIVAEANIGLMEAIDNFDLSKNYRFITYAVYWIVKAIHEYVITTERPIKTKNSMKAFTYVHKVIDKFLKENERMPSIEEIQEILETDYGIRIANKADLEFITFDSIDEYTCGDGTNRGSYSNYTAFENATCTDNISDDIDNGHIKTVADKLLSVLDKREQFIVRHVYGIGSGIQENFDAVGVQLGLCGERIRQIFNAAINKIKKYNDISNINSII